MKGTRVFCFGGRLEGASASILSSGLRLS